MASDSLKSPQSQTNLIDALFQGSLDALVVTLYENERPLQGFSGLLDWRLHGAISKFLKSGKISGKKGECVYLPVLRHGKTVHVLLAGSGLSPALGGRVALPAETLSVLSSNLSKVGLTRVGISKKDFGVGEDQFFTTNFPKVNLCLAP